MVRLHVKHGDESQFLFDTITTVVVEDLVKELLYIYNGRLKIERVCSGKYCYKKIIKKIFLLLVL